MTGEITLRERRCQLAALRRSLAARRGGISTVIIPHENERDSRSA